MAVSPDSKSPLPSNDREGLASSYTSHPQNWLCSLMPVSSTSTDGFLSRIARLYESSKWRHSEILLPLSTAAASDSVDRSFAFTPEAYRIFPVMEEIMSSTLQNLQGLQKNLHFWQSRAEDSNARKAYFMICERGPHAFLNGSAELVRDCLAHEVSAVQKLYSSASSHIFERISVLTNLRNILATFFAKVYMDIDRIEKDLLKDPENSLPALLLAINESFMKLEASIAYFHSNHQSGSSQPLTFGNLSEIYQKGSKWTDLEIRDAINLVSENIGRLDSYLCVLVSKHRKPRKVTLYWIWCSCGILGVSVFSLWLLRHSRLMGSSDIDNWIHDAKDSAKHFWNNHVEQPVLTIRNELFETSRERQKGAMEWEELHRTLQDFIDHTTGQKFPENTPDQEMLENVISRYEKELLYPIPSLVGGELVSDLLIQVQNLKLCTEELDDQILRATKIKLAIVAALPTFFISYVLAMLVRSWLKQDTRAEGRGRVTRLFLLLKNIEQALWQMKNFNDQGLENDSQCMYGLVLCFLDSLYCTVERHEKETGEWICLRQDMIKLAKPGMIPKDKLRITSHMISRLHRFLP